MLSKGAYDGFNDIDAYNKDLCFQYYQDKIQTAVY